MFQGKDFVWTHPVLGELITEDSGAPYNKRSLCVLCLFAPLR
jgi:hypothetical protein